MEVIGDFLQYRRGNVADAGQWLDALINRRAWLALKPKLLNLFLIQKGCRQVGLRIEVDRHHTLAQAGKHPGQVIDQRSFTDPTFIVEES